MMVDAATSQNSTPLVPQWLNHKVKDLAAREQSRSSPPTSRSTAINSRLNSTIVFSSGVGDVEDLRIDSSLNFTLR